jgi:hypothetical protein
MPADPTTLRVDTLSSNRALAAEHVDTITDALLTELRGDLEEARDLVHDHMDRQLAEPSVALADARGRLHNVVAIVAALDRLNPPGWESVLEPVVVAAS